MGKKYPLRPETYEEIIERDQTPVPPQLTVKLMAKCMAFASADRDADFHSKKGNYSQAITAAETCERLREELRPMLDALRAEEAPGEGASSQER